VIENLASTTKELDSSDQVAAAEIVAKLLDSLRPSDRLLMRLMYMEGHTVEEISQLTGWSRTLIKVRAFRARAQLRRRYILLMKENP
jgi:RNA polymerase sigma-70 factor (ECF subfamily)